MESDPGRDEARVLVVENEPHLKGALLSAARTAGVFALGVGTLHAARDALGTQSFVGVILGASLPDGSGLDLLEELRSRQAQLNALVISSSLDTSAANRAHRLGAACVFTPDIAPNVRAFVRRTVGSRADATSRTIAAAGEVAVTYGFTAREREIAELAALGVSRGCLATELGVSENTLKTLIRRALAKCSEKSLEGLARLVLDEVVALSCRTEPV